MENNLAVIINESGLEKSKAEVLLANFSNYFEIAAEWENKAKILVVTDEKQTTEMKMAREGRLFLKEKRVAVEKTRKALKEQSLREGQTIDAIAKILKNLIEPIEEHLEMQERFVEIRETQRKELWRSERLKKLADLQYDPQFVDLLNMSDEAFSMLVSGIEKERADKIEAERIAEEQRIARERAEVEERERIKAENERLRAERERAESEKRAAEEKAADEKKEAEKKLRAERERAEAAEKKAAEMKAAEEKAKADAEKQRVEEEKKRIAAEKKAAHAPDKDKLLLFASSILELQIPTVSSVEASAIIDSAKVLLQKVHDFIKTKSAEL